MNRLSNVTMELSSLKNVPTQNVLKKKLFPLIRNPNSIFFFKPLTSLKNLLSTKKGLSQIKDSEYSPDRDFYSQDLSKFLVNNDVWKNRIGQWYDSMHFSTDAPEDIRSRPENVEHFLTARNKVVQPKIAIQGDLMETTWLNPDGQRKRYNYLLVLVDVFSSYLFAIPLRRKNANVMANALNDFFKENPTYRYLHVDRGNEFVNAEVKAVLDTHNVHLFHTHTMQKAYLSERKIRDIKSFYNKVRHMSSIPEVIRLLDVPPRYNHDDWSGLVDVMVTELNNKKHSRMKFSPTVMQKNFFFKNDDPTLTQDERARAKLGLFLATDNWFKDKGQKFKKAYVMDPYKVKNKKEYRRRLPIGTRVVISKARKKGVTVENPFTKPSQRNSYWDRNVIYTIHSRERVGYPEPFYMYRIKRESDGKVIRARFYRKELFVRPNTRINNFYKNKHEYETFLNTQQTTE